MGWYLRKSAKVGPVRINLSKSGIGYSFGVKGARIGTGPRGPYVAGGRYGIYFRRFLGKPSPPEPPALQGISQPTATGEPQYCQECGAQWIPGNRYCIQCGAEAILLPASSTAAEIRQHSVWMWAAALVAGVLLIAYVSTH